MVNCTSSVQWPVQLSGGDLSNNLLQTLAEPSLVFDSILRQGAFDSCQQLTSYKVKWSIAEAGWLEEKVITGTGQVSTRTMSQQSTPQGSGNDGSSKK